MKSGKNMMQKKVRNEELKKYSLAANKEVASIAAELIAFRELKGEQVPVEEADYTRYSCGCCGFESLHRTTKCPECNFHKIESEPLYTAPQKPVVLLPKFTDRHTCINAGCDAASAYKEDVIAMNKAAGGNMKESE